MGLPRTTCPEPTRSTHPPNHPSVGTGTVYIVTSPPLASPFGLQENGGASKKGAGGRGGGPMVDLLHQGMPTILGISAQRQGAMRR